MNDDQMEKYQSKKRLIELKEKYEQIQKDVEYQKQEVEGLDSWQKQKKGSYNGF